jgi:drug/metabolite transporter (DMT)-like permease
MRKSETANQQPDKKIIILVILLALLWGGNSVSIKIGLQDIPPLALAGFRFLLGLLAVGGWSVSQRIRIALNPREFLPLICLSVIFLLQIISLNIGTQFTNASRSTILISTYPFFTALFAHFWIPGDRLYFNKTVGIMLAFFGVLLTFGKNLQSEVQVSFLGDLVVLASGCLLGLRVVATKLLVQFIHPCRLLSFFLESGVGYQLSVSGVVAILYQGLVIAGFCFVSWTSVLKKYSPSKLVVLFFTTPLFGVLLSHLLLGDEVSSSLILGVGLVAFGIYMVNKHDTRRADKQ